MSTIFVSVIAFYLTGLISLFGLVGNIFSMLVLIKFCRQKQRTASLFIILATLCVVDVIFILSNFFINVLGVFYEFHQLNFKLIFIFFVIQGYTIKYLMPVTFTMQLMSIYLTVLVSYERFNAICKPLSTVTQAKKTSRNLLVVVLILSSLFNLPKFFELDVVHVDLKSEIEPVEKAQRIENISNIFFFQSSNFSTTKAAIIQSAWVVSDKLTYNISGDGSVVNLYNIVYHGIAYCLVYFILPVGCITYLNIQIVHGLRTSRRINNTNKDVHLTYISLSIVVSFYVLMLPNVLWTCISVVLPISYHVDANVTPINNFLVLLSSCLNFVLYCVFGKKFRKCLTNICLCKSETRNIPGSTYIRRLNSAKEYANMTELRPNSSCRQRNHDTNNVNSRLLHVNSSQHQNSTISTST